MTTDQTDHRAEAVWAAAVALIAHTRLSVDGRCSCGHVVPLGYSVAEHQAEAAVAAARPALEREAKAAAWDEGYGEGVQRGIGLERTGHLVTRRHELGPIPTNPYRQEADQ